MKIADFSVKNSMLVNMASVFIVIVGLFIMFGMKREAFPHVTFDMAVITTVYPGAQAIDVEKFVTTPIEKEIKGIDGIDELTSTSSEGLSFIIAQLDPDIDEIEQDRAVKDIERAVDRVTDLPAEVEEPIVTKPSSKEHSVVYISIGGDDELVLQDQAEILEDLLEDIEGVSKLQRLGWRDKEIWVEVDPEKLKENYVSLDEVMTALRNRNISVPAGELRTRQEEFVVRTTGEFRTPEEIEDVIVRANDLGNLVRIRDVATVKFTLEDDKVIYTTDNKRSIFLGVIKKADGDAIRIVDEVKEKIKEFKKTSPVHIEYKLIDDMSYYIKRRLNVLTNNGFIGIILVVAALLIFLNRWIAIWTAFGIPIAFFATFIVMAYMGISINLMSMFGLIIVLGMIVDDGIIISENVYRYIETGMPLKEAAVRGTNEVIKPVTATVLTTVVAFMPLMFMSGIMGKFVRIIPEIVIIALAASMLEAFVILPSHLSDFVRPPKKDPVTGEIRSKKDLRWFKAIADFYERVLVTLVNHRFITVGALVLGIILCITVGLNMDRVLFPSKGIEAFYVKAEFDVGTPLATTQKAFPAIGRLIDTLPPEELDTYFMQVGSTGEWSIIGSTEEVAAHKGQVVVYLTPIQNRKRTAQQIISDLRAKADKVEELKVFKKLVFENVKPGPPVGKPVAVQLKGEEFSVLTAISKKYQEALSTMKGVKDIEDDYELGKDELTVVIDREAAAKAYLTVNDIARSIRYVFEGGIATSIKPLKAEEEVDVKVRFKGDERNTPDAFGKVLLRNSLGNLIPLDKVAHVEKNKSLARIHHLDGERVVTVSAEVDEKVITSDKANKMIMRKFKDFFNDYPGYSANFGGEFEENKKSMLSFVKAFFISVFLIYVILASTFGSLMQPMIIIFSMFFGWVGVVVAFLVHREPISFLACMGIVGLNGVVVNDSIVLIEFINMKRREGLPLREAVLEAGYMRLRPVILTTITTVGGLLPVAYGIGGNDPFLKPMALALSWGLAFGTTLILLMIPCIYLVVDDIKRVFLHHVMRDWKFKKNGNGNAYTQAQ